MKSLIGYLLIVLFVSFIWQAGEIFSQATSGAKDKQSAGKSASAPAAGGANKLPANFKLVCIGDSLSQGRKGKGEGNDRMTFSWRYSLWKLFVDADIKAEFVGSLNGGFNGDPDWADYKDKKFPRNHEAHWGWPTQKIADELPGWIKNYTPDVAMILLGGNDDADKKGTDPTIKAMTSIVETLRSKNPKVIVFIGLPYRDWKPFPELRKALGEFAGKLNTNESPVIGVDHSKGWVSKPDDKDTCTVDWVHPNIKGDEILAKNWFEALKPFLIK